MLQEVIGTNVHTDLPDTQSMPDHRSVDIDQVGVKGLRYPIKITNKAGKTQHTIGTFNLSVGLSAEHRGTHMSRFVEILNGHGLAIRGHDLAGVVLALQKRLQSPTARIEMEFPYFIEKEAPVTKAKGLVDYTIHFVAQTTGQGIETVATVKVPIKTLCPCSKAISEYGAHNQRGYVTLSVKGSPDLWFDDLITIVEASGSCEIYSMLKRPDEKAVTEQAYDNPVFVEDVVRNVATQMIAMPDLVEWYKVEAENMESIHNHSAYACIEKHVGGKVKKPVYLPLD
jgi:GTP cyclohydrolase I